MKAISSHLDFITLQTPEGLARLDAEFVDFLRSRDPSLAARLAEYRSSDESWAPVDTSNFLLELAPLFEDFVVSRFDISDESGALRQRIERESVIAKFKKEFVQKRARRYRGDEPESFEVLDKWVSEHVDRIDDPEMAVARFAMELLENNGEHDQEIERMTQWCVAAAGYSNVSNWVSFTPPRPVDPAYLVPLERDNRDDMTFLQESADNLRQRDGFKLTDPRMSLRESMDQVHYCVFCHDHDGDFCSKGFPEKKKAPELGLKVNPLGVTLTGCPLDEKISEMHSLMAAGRVIAALSVAMVDNPMLPATGHRICNDCMKACIYQKQDPVNIPQIETRILTESLQLPWGVEIYDLLTRWNPLRRTQYRMHEYNGRKVLIAGMGPAGFTMAHYLTMEGCAVVGIDGLKIEPLPKEFLTSPVRDYASMCESLDERTMAGFGGVAEYGITVRWDKNFLKLIYLTLARRPTFNIFGGVRLGGTLTMNDIWSLDFDHLCIANGAGLPRVIPMGNSLARGMRQANDFLMALQLTGAAKSDSLATLQVRMPAVVIGGGLTAIDTATEVQAYYIKQVEKVLDRHEALVADIGDEAIRAGLDPEHNAILDEFLGHGRAVRAERQRAEEQDRRPDFVSLLRSWGGVTVVYRRSINESPAYLRNHEEIIKAMEEGIFYAEGLEPVRAEVDRYGHVESLVCRPRVKEGGRWMAKGKEVSLPSRAILVAAGTFPNTIYENEHPGTFEIEGDHFLPHVVHKYNVQPVRVAEHCKAPVFGPFTSYEKDRHRVTFIGDAHPVFHGSVVKAIASAARSYPEVMAGLSQLPAVRADLDYYNRFTTILSEKLAPRVDEIRDSHPAFIELFIKAPMAARNFEPGQFFRFQTYESFSQKVDGTRLQIPLQTISGAGVDGDRIRLFLMRFGMNPKLAARLKPGDPVVLMGPTGAPTAIRDGRTVLVIAGSWGAAVMLSLGPALKARGNRVLYFAAYPNAEQVYYQPELEQCADQIVWLTGKGPLITTNRPNDISLQATDAIEVIDRYGHGRLDRPAVVGLKDVDEILVMGSTSLLRAFQHAMRDGLAGLFRENVEIVGTVGSPMQCMLKGVCAQCLQWQVDPDTGERTRAVFSCAMQDQPLLWIDVENLAARQKQNRLQDHLTDLWVDHVLRKAG